MADENCSGHPGNVFLNKGMEQLCQSCLFKKCCKKYKKGRRCKNCPKKDK